MWRRAVLALIALVALIVLYLLYWPTGIDPQPWNPPPAPALEGPFAPNDRLAHVERLAEGVGVGPETIAIDAEGRIYGGFADGRIVRINADGSGATTFAQTGGRPLGLEFDPRGNLIVADADKGLLAVAPDGNITVLATEHGGVPFRLVDDVAIGRDGTIYFTDASHKFSLGDLLNDFLEHGANGRLLAYDPTTRATRLLLGDLYFANGVAVSPDQTFLLVNETSKYRVRRVWLAGPNQGRSDVLIDNLPGFPDNIAYNGRDTYWIALVAPRSRELDALLPRPRLRAILARLPQALWPKPTCHAFVLGIDADGKVVQNLQDPKCSRFGSVSAVTEHAGALYLGSLTEPAIGRLKLD
ncbi:MAG TPA: SMP-30/gluconolactonase/LRE family protein [Burkholderiales bacterium]